jgi:protein NRD1
MPYGAPAPVLGQDAGAALQQQILLFKTLSDQGIPQEQWAGIIAALSAVQTQGVAGGMAGMMMPGQGAAPTANQGAWGARPAESRDRMGYPEPIRSPNGRYGRRSRSPSPARGWGARDSPNNRRRDEPGYGDYDRGRDSSPRGRGRGNDYRQRSPQGRNRSLSPPRGEKWTDYDPSIGKDSIKVLSRTLFVGGVTFVSPLHLSPTL